MMVQAPTRLLIVRHGNTFAPNEVVRRVGRTDLPLVTDGLEQAKQIGLWLQQQAWQPACLWTSQLQRTRQTAEQIKAVLGCVIPTKALPALNEIDYGEDENQPETNVIARLGKAALHAWEAEAIVPAGWQVNPATLMVVWQQLGQQIVKQYPGQLVVVITSNGVARFATGLIKDPIAHRQSFGLKLATGAMALLEHTDPGAASSWVCRFWNIRPVLS